MSYDREKITYRVGTRIRELRTDRKLSQEALALSSSLHPAYLGRVERGETCPSVETIYKIADGLHITVSELFDFDMNRIPDHTDALRRIEAQLQSMTDEQAIQVAEIIEKISTLYSKDR